MFHARKWGWKRLAAKLLLLPLFGACGAGAARAQSAPVAPAAGMPAAARSAGAAQMPGGDPKAMLKEGRKALAAGQFDRAQDLARAAEANNPTGKWGLFDDTPRSLLDDVQKAVAKNQKHQAEQLAKEAKGLMHKPAGNDAEKAANLDRALQLATRAGDLHGPNYSAWEFGDRPDKLVKDIQAARGKLKTPATPVGPGGVAGNPAAGGSAFQASAGSPAARAGDPKKAAAVQMMTDARKLADQGQFGAARAKLVEADRLGAAFGPREYNPGFALQELNTRGKGAMDRLLTEAQGQIAKKDFGKADAALNGAQEIASGLGLFPRPVHDAREQLWAASGGKFGTAPAGAGNTAVAAGGPAAPVGPISPAGPVGPVGLGPVAPVKPAGPMNPMNPAGVATVGGSQPVAPAGGNATGRQLLEQAAYEFSRGELDMAARLASQAYNAGGVKDESSDLLRSIDSERHAQRKLTATRSFEAAQTAVKNRDYGHALGVLVLIDPMLLQPESKAQHAELIAQCRTALGNTGTAVAAGGTQTGDPQVSPGDPPMPLPGGMNPPGSARVGSDPKVTNPDSVAGQQDALRRVQFQKLRADGLKVQADAQAAFGRGETDLAIQMLADYANRVRSAGIEPSGVALLLRPIDSRLEMFRVMKGQADALARVNRESREAKDFIAGRGLAEEQRRAEVKVLVAKFHELAKKSQFAEAEKVAMQAKQLDPDDPALAALAHMAKVQKRVREQEQLKDAKEKLVYEGLRSAEQPGPAVTTDDPVSFNLERFSRASRRGSLDGAYLKTRSQAEYEIELKLDKPIPIEINQTPLDRAIDHLREVTNLPISIDNSAIEAEGINIHKPVSEKLTPVATRHVLTILLEKAGLSYVVENDVVKVTTMKKAKGRLFTKVFSVADLVTPIPNFALPDYANFDKMLNRGTVHLQGITGAPRQPANGLSGGQMVGQQQLPGASATSPGLQGGLNFGSAGQLQASGLPNPLDRSSRLAGDANTKHEQLIKLITGMVRPYSWDGMGGPGRIEYFDIGSALVVNQVADVIQEVADLLEALRRLQDLAIAVEIRIVSLSETWFERMGVDFSMNILTHNTQFEPALTQIDPNTGLGGVFRPLPFLNSNQFKGVTVGLTPAGTFTGDLGVPIRPNNFNMAVPPFGGYPNNPGNNGGISLGLAFLNDIQVFMFMEAAQGDRRVNVMQAPKITLFNGQTATLSVSDLQFFVTDVTVVSVNGQIVFIPQNTPLPGPGGFQNGGALTIAVQAVVSADRRFVRLNLPVNMSAQTGATVPLFPITTFVTPVFEGGSQGVPIPFTQFLQQPSFTNLNIQTTVVCPDGGTVLLGGLKTLSEGRNEFGPPFLSKIPYLNRLFKNVGIGRETTHIMIMVTPRIIINAEEEIFQTEGGRAPGAAGGGGQ